MTSRLKIIAKETDNNKVNMTELTLANDYVRERYLYETNETYIIKLKRDIDQLIDLYKNGDDKINSIERIKQYLKNLRKKINVNMDNISEI